MAPLSLALKLSCYGVLATQIENGINAFSALGRPGCVFMQCQCNIQLKRRCRSPGNSLSHK